MTSTGSNADTGSRERCATRGQLIFLAVLALAIAVLVAVVNWPSHDAATPADRQPKPSDIAEILDEQAAALVAGDEAGWLAPVHSERPDLRDRYDKLYQMLRALGVTDFQPNPEMVDQLLAEPLAPVTVTVLFGYCTQMVPCPSLPTARAGNGGKPVTNPSR